MKENQGRLSLVKQQKSHFTLVDLVVSEYLVLGQFACEGKCLRLSQINTCHVELARVGLMVLAWKENGEMYRPFLLRKPRPPSMEREVFLE